MSRFFIGQGSFKPWASLAIGPSQMCTIACGGINAIGEGEEILVFISTNFFSHQSLIDPLLVLPPYLSHEYVSAFFLSHALQEYWDLGGESDNIGEVDTITEASSTLPSLSSAGILHVHTSCSGSIFFEMSRNSLGQGEEARNCQLANAQPCSKIKGT